MASLHKKVVNTIRRCLQEFDDSIYLFHNQTGTAWQGSGVPGARLVELRNPRPVKFGIPNSGGGPDLLGWKVNEIEGTPHAIAMAVEVKTGRARRAKNQQNFAKVFSQCGGIYLLVRGNEASWRIEEVSAFNVFFAKPKTAVFNVIDALCSKEYWFKFVLEQTWEV